MNCCTTSLKGSLLRDDRILRGAYGLNFHEMLASGPLAMYSFPASIFYRDPKAQLNNSTPLLGFLLGVYWLALAPL